ncbi:T6SS effector BTH_I2691 family protein [Pseudomonas paralactis]|uniref:T6SS effector BTH_I2691 family protein n=1 Tax=Pseudomonas paralactis TaxID=1615673 RepID=UPI0023EE7FC5|nr:T6SS effector BTH_I2691 family protein [Pseudomonas paralactis]
MSQCDPSKKCSVCDQLGVALMPLRYAVAQPATKRAPAIQAPFGDGLESVPLPTDSAHYTMRHLRGGYLYVFNEVRGEWKAYVVTEDAYLVEYDIHDKTPPDPSGASPCSRMAKSAASRCVMIPDAIRAGPVWFGFSDVAWTERVLERHRQSAYRDKHMRCIDLGAWAKSQTVQPHLTGLSEAREVVAEYHLPAEPKAPVNSVTVHGYKAFMHSPQDFHNCHDELDPFLASAHTSGCGVPPAMVALADPVGIALELNALTLGQVERFEQKDDRDWKKATSTAIQGLRQMLEEAAVATALERHQGERYATFEGMPLHPEWDEAARERNELIFSSLPAAKEAKVRADAWARYIDNYREADRIAFEEQLQVDLEQFMQTTVTPLVRALASWYWGKPFGQAMLCNHDAEDWDSGLCFTTLVTASLTGLTGHPLIIDQVVEDLRGRYSDPNNLTMRALVLNNDRIAARLDEAATPELVLGNPFAWRNVLNAFGHVLDEHDKGLVSGGLARAAGLAHQISGALVRSLGNPLKTGASGALDLSIRYRMLGLLGALSGKQILSLSTTASEAQMAHIISEKVALLQPGVDRKALQNKVTRELRQLEKQPGVREATGAKNARNRKVFSWSLMYDADVGKALNLDSRGKLNSNTPLLMSQEELRRVVAQRHTTLPKLAQIDVGVGVVGGILDGWNAYMAVQQLDKQGLTVKSGTNFMAAVIGLAGGGAELAGGIWSKYPAGRLKLAKAWNIFGKKILTRSAALQFAGKLLGALGGLLTSIVDLMSGIEAFKQGDFWTAGLRFTTAVLGVVIVILVVFTTMTAGVGLLLFMALAGISFLGDWLIGLFKDNKIEAWINRTPFGTSAGDGYYDLDEQQSELNTLLGIKGVME